MHLATLILRLAFALLIFAVPLTADATQDKVGKVSRVGYLHPSFRTQVTHLMQAFEERLRESGHVIGQSVIIEYRFANGQHERLSALASELVELNVNVIVAVTNPAIRAAKQATSATPIVMVSATDPVGAGFIKSLPHPGSNLTGVAFDTTPETFGKNLELLRSLLPSVSRIAVLGNPTFYRSSSALAQYWTGAIEAGRRLGLRIRAHEVRTPEEIEPAFDRMTAERTEGLFVLPDPGLTYPQRRRIVELAAVRRLPAVYILREFVDDGGLMAYGVHLPDLNRRAAVYVDRILKGARSTDLPVEQPTKFELVINLKTAKALGLTVPQSILLRADEVIQ